MCQTELQGRTLTPRDPVVLVGLFAISCAALCACSSNKHPGSAAGKGAQAAGPAGSQVMTAADPTQTMAAGGNGAGTGTTGGAGTTSSAGAGGTTPGQSPDAQGGGGAQASTADAGGSGGAPAKQADCSPPDWKDPATVSNPKVVAVAADAGKTGHMFGRTPGLSSVDYVEEEFFFTGTSPAYTTRMVVERPKDPAKYNGTVMMEWYNVSGQVDFAPDWMYSRAYFVREGYVHISVSAQQVGADALKNYDADRYMAINHPGDSSANAIFSQAAMAIRSQGGLLLGGPCMPVRALVAIGQSQSSLMLASYVDNEQPKAKLIDAFVLHSGGEPASNNPAAPVFEIFSMTEGNGSLVDGPNLVKWVIAGATHNDDFITKEGLAELGADVGITTMTVCTNPMNDFPSYRAYDAVFDWTNRWVRKGDRPPAGAPYETTGSGLKLDADGNVLGGVRLPEIDAPTATYSTDNSAKDITDFMSAFVCSLSGTTIAFTANKLQMLYPTHDDYVKKYTSAADKALAAGYLLQADYDEAIKQAQSAPVPN